MSPLFTDTDLKVPGTLGYAEVVANQGGIISEVDLTGLAVTVTVPAGRRLRITGLGIMQSSVANDNGLVGINEGATVLQQAVTQLSQAARTFPVPVSVIVSPTAGTHTYKLRGWRLDGTGTITLVASSSLPNYILVEDITGIAETSYPLSVPVGVLAQTATGLSLANFSTESDIPGSTLNISVPAGRTLKITATGRWTANTTGGHIVGRIKQDGAEIGRFNNTDVVAGSTDQAQNSVLVSPSAGMHTYKLTAEKFSGGNTANVDQSWMFIEDITPTPAPANTAPSSTLGYVKVTANQTGITSVTDLTGLSLTVTIPEGRRIKVSFSALFERSVVDGTSVVLIHESGSDLRQVNYQPNIAAQSMQVTSYVILTPTAGSHTYKLRLATSSGTGSSSLIAGAGWPAELLIEDITGVGVSGHTHPELDVVNWIEVTSFTNSWVNYSASTHPTAAYRKIGNIVYLKGLIKNGTISTPAFTLPVGYRPAYDRHFIAMMTGGAGGLRVIASGNVTFGDPNGGGNGYCSLDGIHFETNG